MRKFLSVLLTLCMALCLGLTLAGCNQPAPEGPGGPSGPSGPTYSSITETEWEDMLLICPSKNFTVVENFTDPQLQGRKPEFKINQFKVSFNPDGITPQVEEDYDTIDMIVAMFDFYKNISFADLTFSTTNNTYSYASPIEVSVPNLDNYTNGVIKYIYTNIVITLAENENEELVIGEISLTRESKYTSTSEFFDIVLKYSNFGSTNA